MRSSHTRAVLLALFVTVLWSSSWVLIKIGLKDIPALTFAGLRYMLAFLALLVVAAWRRQLGALAALPARSWVRLIALGVILYALTQGAQFLSLFYLPAMTTSLMLSFTSIFVALLGGVFLQERLTWVQWSGIAVYLAAVFTYIGPGGWPRGQTLGLVIAAVGMLANALAAILGRAVNRSGELEPLQVTVVSMGVGASLLLGSGVALQGLPHLGLRQGLIVLWLALVNSALAYTLWNRALRALSAVESTILNNTMLFQIALLAWAFLGESLTLRQVAAVGLAFAGTALAQLSGPTRGPAMGEPPAALGDPTEREHGA